VCAAGGSFTTRDVECLLTLAAHVQPTQGSILSAGLTGRSVNHSPCTSVSSPEGWLGSEMIHSKEEISNSNVSESLNARKEQDENLHLVGFESPFTSTKSTVMGNTETKMAEYLLPIPSATHKHRALFTKMILYLTHNIVT
jgi:hypothetical protein